MTCCGIAAESDRGVVAAGHPAEAAAGLSILEAGGSRPAMESFKAFRGREPSQDALLRHQGMA